MSVRAAVDLIAAASAAAAAADGELKHSVAAAAAAAEAREAEAEAGARADDENAYEIEFVNAPAHFHAVEYDGTEGFRMNCPRPKKAAWQRLQPPVSD